MFRALRDTISLQPIKERLVHIQIFPVISTLQNSRDRERDKEAQHEAKKLQ